MVHLLPSWRPQVYLYVIHHTIVKLSNISITNILNILSHEYGHYNSQLCTELTGQRICLPSCSNIINRQCIRAFDKTFRKSISCHFKTKLVINVRFEIFLITIPNLTYFTRREVRFYKSLKQRSRDVTWMGISCLQKKKKD